MVVASLNERRDPVSVRKLKAHKKSRRGCGNCKLRKIKVSPRSPASTLY